MKKRFISFALVCILLLIFPACSSKQNNDYGGDPMEFKSFKLTENNCSVQNAVYRDAKQRTEYILSII